MATFAPPICARCGAALRTLGAPCERCGYATRERGWTLARSQPSSAQQSDGVARQIAGGAMIVGAVAMAALVPRSDSTQGALYAGVGLLMAVGLWAIGSARAALATSARWEYSDPAQRVTARVHAAHGRWFGHGAQRESTTIELDRAIADRPVSVSALKSVARQLDGRSMIAWSSIELRWSLALLRLVAARRVRMTEHAARRWTRAAPDAPPDAKVERRLAFECVDAADPTVDPIELALLSSLEARPSPAEEDGRSLRALIHGIRGIASDQTSHRPWLRAMYRLAKDLVDEDSAAASDRVELDPAALERLRQIYVELAIIVDDD